MTATELARKQDLCANLNMKFDEANELFESETLKTMTMAQVNGGNPIVWFRWILEIGGAIAAAITIHQAVKQEDPPPTPDPSTGIRFGENGEILVNGHRADTVRVVYSNGYVLNMTGGFNPTPPPPTP